MLNVPNTISLFRLVLVPVVVYLLTQSAYAYALVVFLIASISDGIDGWIARHYNLCTPLGAMLDPVADKLIILSCLMTLTWQSLIPLWLTLSLLARDMVVVLGAMAYRRLIGHVKIAPSWLGKTHIALEFALLCLVLANAAAIFSVAVLLPGLFKLVFATAVLSATQYVWIWGRKAGALHTRKTR